MVALTEAIFGLIGVVVGALLNAVVAVLRERATTKAAARAAARLVGIELMTFTTVIRAARYNDPADLPQVRLLDASQWRTHRDVLARVLDDAAWSCVAIAYAHVEGALSLLVFEPDGSLATWRVQELRRELRRTYSAAVDAMVELNRLAGSERTSSSDTEDDADSWPFDGTDGGGSPRRPDDGGGPFPVYA